MDTDEHELTRILRNNVAYDNLVGAVFQAPGAVYTHSNNSWDFTVTIDAADFASIPETPEIGFEILSASRQEDGSLPDLGDYFHLAPGSDLIDAGTNVGLPYSGSAPDLGAFEYTG